VNPSPQPLPSYSDQSSSPKQQLDDWFWRWWFTVPIYPYSRRRTLRHELLPDQIWAFEQLQGVFYVTVPIRMTVVRLAAGGLLVYAPIAPTKECLRLMAEIVEKHGSVKHIILPTVSGLEHKAPAGPFARYFPKAQVWVAPEQWSFPLNLPLPWLGFPAPRTKVLPSDSSKTPFGDEFDYEILPAISLGLGKFSEVAFFHRSSRSLLVTDTLLSLPETPPEIVQLDPYPLLFHARDSAQEPVEDTPANQIKGWQRITIFSMYFRAASLTTPTFQESLAAAKSAPDRSRRAFYGLYPFQWDKTWSDSFQQLRGHGQPLVAPILRELILNRGPVNTATWIDAVTRWQLERLIPCHFAAPVMTNPEQIKAAFAFLYKEPLCHLSCINANSLLPELDLALLRDIDQQLLRFRITPPPQPKLEK
jgi:hypothetical protein